MWPTVSHAAFGLRAHCERNTATAYAVQSIRLGLTSGRTAGRLGPQRSVFRGIPINEESGRTAVSSQLTGVGTDEGAAGEFGANEWLVDELYEQYIVDKNSVDKSWWPILEAYTPNKAK